MRARGFIRLGRHAKGSLLDRVAHAGHRPFFVGLYAEQRAARARLEEPVVPVNDLVFHVHVVLRETRIKLQLPEYGANAVALDIHNLPDSLRTDRASAAPLLDRQFLDCWPYLSPAAANTDRSSN
jgi:hypothetical protein